jgi:hypothetical protein
MIPYKKAALAGGLGTLGFAITGFVLTQKAWDGRQRSSTRSSTSLTWTCTTIVHAHT